MKKLNLIKRLWTDSHEKQKPQRFVRYAAMLIMLLTIGVGQMWADAQFDAVYMVFDKNGTEDAYDFNSNSGHGDYLNGCTITTSLKVKKIYMKFRKYNGNVCTDNAYLGYNIGNGDQKVQPSWTWASSDHWGSDGNQLKNESVNHTIASSTDPSGVYHLYMWWHLTGNLSSNSGCSHEWWMKNGGSTNYDWTYKILPPAVKSGTVSISATNTAPGSGTGLTSGSPIILISGMASTLTITATQNHTDANSALWCKFGSNSYSSTTTYNIASGTTTTNQTLALKVKYRNNSASLDGAETTATIYYKWAAPAPAISFGSVSPAALVSGNDVTLVGTRYNSSNTISFQYSTDNGESWTNITPKTSSLSSNTLTATWTVPEAHGATQTYKFRAKLAEATPIYSGKSDGVTVYNTKTIHVRNINDWATFNSYVYNYSAGATTDKRENWPGSTTGITTLAGQWKNVVLTSQYTYFILNNGSSSSQLKGETYTYSGVSNDGYYTISQGSGSSLTLTSTTAPAAPTATTNDANEITSTTAKFNYSVSANRDKTTPGIAFKQSDDDVDAATIYSSGTKVPGSAILDGNASGSTAAQTITPGKKYYYVAYGTNGFGTSYGTVKSFVAPYKVTITQPTGCSAITPGTGTQYVHIGDEISSTATTGYTFSSWSVTNVTLSSPTTTEGVTTSTITAISADNGTIQPVYTENMTTVNLVASPTGKGTFTSGGTVTSVSAGVDTHPTVTAVPAEGYHLTGTIWSKSNEYISLSSTTTTATTITATGTSGNTTNLTATFTPNTYTVQFHRNGGAGDVVDQDFTYDAAQNLTANTYTKTGYSFAGWATSTSGEVVYANGANVSNLTSENGATFHLYAKWTPNPYTVVLDKQTSAEGYGSEGTVANQTVTFDATPATVSGTMPSAANGYAFMGFYSATGGNGRLFIDPSGNWVTSAGDTISGGKWVKPAGITLYAYYKKAEITTLALSAGTVLPEGSVTATATIEPTPTPTTIVCWKLLYNNGTEYSPQPTFTPASGSEVSFNAPEASGTYKVQAQLRTGGVCGGGTLLSENETSFVVAGTHNVTIQYKCDGVNVKAATVVEGVKPLEWSETITPGDEPFGYTFARWEAGDGVTIKDGSGEDKTTSTSSTIKIKAIYDGRLTAVYTKKNIIYFKNTLGWSEVYVNLYPYAWWSSTKGAGNQSLADEKRNKLMTQLGETDIWYYEYGNTATTAYVSFTDRTQNNYEGFAGTNGSNKVQVSYPTRPDATAAEDANYGFNAGTPMFVPIEQTAQPWNKSGGVDLAEYYNKGYWRAYDPTTGESGSTGYTLKIYNQTEGNSSRKLLQSIPFTNADASGQIFKATAGLNAAVGYGIKVERDNSLMYTNTEGHLHRTGDVVTMSVNPDNYAAIWIKSTAAGDYDFIITCNGSGQLCLQATFPAAEKDYRVLYTDNATWSNAAHVKQTWVHPSRVISAAAGATDTISFFVSKDNSPEYKIQRVSGIDEGTGAITWADVTSWTSISVAKTGVYNFIFNQPAAGSISLSKTEEYDGNFYIRTDNAGSTKWENYRAEDHKMTYSEYAAKVSHADVSMDFTHYFMKFVDKDKESGKYKNVKFTIANDYSACISDTLIQQTGDIAPSHVNASGDLQANANIRFMWNIKNNKLQRAYLAAAQSDGTKFLVLQGKSGELLAPDGTALSNENSNNHGGGTDAIQFTDKEHWMYDAEVKAVPGGRVKLYAVFNGSTFYYYGDGDALFDGSHAIELISGSGGAQDIRVIYDFKTDRLIAAWVPSDGDINAPQTINADIMLIREHQNAGKQINLTGTGSISTNKTVYGVMRFNRWTLNNKSTVNTGTTENPIHAVLPVGEQKSQYERFNYMISFPFDVQVGEIFGFGTIGRHYRIYYYDGLGRAKEGFFAERGDDNWRMIDDTDSILHANQGYLLQLNYIRMADDNTATWPQKNMNEVELYFPAMNAINTISLADVEIPALGDAYKCKINLQPTYHALNNPDSAEADRRIKDSYWRCIGVPGFTSYEATASSWTNFNWKVETDSLPYLYEWQMDDNKLSVVSSSTFTFKPMHAYLIQNGKSFTWESVAHPTVAAPRRSAAEEGFYEFYLEMQNGEQALDHTYVRLTDKENITADFDFGQDLSKELNSGANIFTKVGYERLAANNLPLSEQTTIVPVGVKIAAEGNYTFAMPEGTHGIGVTLVDNETGDRTNLSLFDYSVNLTKGDYDNRFILEISPIQQMPTDIDNVQGESAQSEKARKVMIDGILYIVKDGVVFDARGSRVK